jgi:decaprenyl-phosphate phosphoribosyltransferase
MTLFSTYLKLIRPKQWIKNFFVLAPLVFAKQLFEPEPLLEAVKAFVGFCLMASSVYIINDIADVEADRSHPEKKYRPLAARSMPISHAFVILTLCLVACGFIVAGIDVRYLVCIALYFGMNLAYSFKLKEVVLLDVFIIAAGFMLRVLGGAYAIQVQVSNWIVLCTMFVSLFLGFAKRRSELVQAQEAGSMAKRKVLSLYEVGFIDQMLTIAAAGTVISYALWTVAPRTLEVFGTDKMIYTTVFVIYGIFRYLNLIHMAQPTESPTDAITSDRTIISTVLLWVLACVVLIYLGGQHPVFRK